MGLISKLKGKDKHEKEEDTNPVTANSPSKSYYTGPQSDSTPAEYGKDTTPAPPTGPPGTYTASNTHDNNFGSNTTAGTHGQLNDTLSGGRHGPGSSDRYDTAPSSGHNLGSHGQLNDTLASGGRHGPTLSHDYNKTPGAFPGSDSGLGHSSGRPDHIDRDGYGPSGVVHDSHDRYGSTTSSGPVHSSGPNFSGRDAYNARDAPGPYGTRDDYAGDRGPASHTLGPHDSNIKNVVDPRVQPQPEKMHTHNTVGPHQSDTLNRMDPRVTADPRAHGYPRDPHDAYDSRDPRDFRYDDRGGRQTGGLVGGPHERLENDRAVPTAGGARVGAGAHDDPYDSYSHGSGMTRDPYDSRSRDPRDDPYGPASGAGYHDNLPPRGGPGGPSGGMAPERQMGGAFEAGYKTAMEHAKHEPQRF